MKVALIEPFYAGSHKSWAEKLKTYSSHEIEIYGLPGRFWKWRMHGGAISLAKKVIESNDDYDVFLVSDFTDLSVFKSLVISKFTRAKFYIYFHENQLTYPWSPNDEDPDLDRDQNYSFINYTSALVAEKIFFNSTYHLNSFISGLHPFLRKFPDYNNIGTIDIIKKKSLVLNLAVELPKLQKQITKIPKSILWNHRWEYDKNPEDFFAILKRIKENGIIFKLIVLGERTNKYPDVFDWAKGYFKEEILHFGYVSSKRDYWDLLLQSEILPVTSNQDFFGVSAIEAMHSNVYPLLPNRLAFPEHIPQEEHRDHLYDTNEELEVKLTKLLLSDTIYMKPFPSWVNKYSWQKSIKNYDVSLINSFHES